MKNVLGVKIFENEFSILREKANIDLLIVEKNNAIVIENKIKSNINGICERHDIGSELIQSQLKKYREYVEKNYQDVSFKKYLVLDSTTGQNAVSQVKEFHNYVELDGIILTKLDGTAKGGIAVAIANEYNLGVKFVGTGEQIDDIEPFDSESYANEII